MLNRSKILSVPLSKLKTTEMWPAIWHLLLILGLQFKFFPNGSKCLLIPLQFSFIDQQRQLTVHQRKVKDVLDLSYLISKVYLWSCVLFFVKLRYVLAVHIIHIWTYQILYKFALYVIFMCLSRMGEACRWQTFPQKQRAVSNVKYLTQPYWLVF